MQKRKEQRPSRLRHIPSIYPCGIQTQSKSGQSNGEYRNVLGLVDFDGRYELLKPFTHHEHGKEADPTFTNLFKGSTSVSDIAPLIGAEIRGVQISELDDKGKDQLALFTAQKKVVGESLKA